MTPTLGLSQLKLTTERALQTCPQLISELRLAAYPKQEEAHEAHDQDQEEEIPVSQRQ